MFPINPPDPLPSNDGGFFRWLGNLTVIAFATVAALVIAPFFFFSVMPPQFREMLLRQVLTIAAPIVAFIAWRRWRRSRG